MLTEADMIRIMAAKYSLAESLTKENIESESNDITCDENCAETLCYDMSNIGCLQHVDNEL